CGSVFIMASYPERALAVLVATLGRQIEVLVVDAEGVDAAREGRIRAEDLALLVLEEDAHALALRGEGILLDEVVERLFLLHFLGREGDVEVPVEIVAVRRIPLEAPAHAPVIRRDLGVGRARDG